MGNQEIAQVQARADAAEERYEHVQDTMGFLSDPAPPARPHGGYADQHRIQGARDMKRHWKVKVEDMRRQCKQRGLDSSQELCMHLKKGMQAQKESLVRFLHIARADGLIVAADEAQPGLIWAAFRVVCPNFFQRVVALFGMELSDVSVNSQSWRTINNAWSNLGFTPNAAKGKHNIWTMAYSGQLDFVTGR
jgi:hypothetical protein